MTELKDSYNTISSASEGIYKEKGSKFISFAFPISNVNEAKEHLDVLSKKYYDARHICYAYRIGSLGDDYRINDDGEPSGSAGKPIYGQLLSMEVSNILVAVVRYFGGVKLGVGGLVQAYKNATQDALINANIIQKIVSDKVVVYFTYNEMSIVMRTIKKFELSIHSQELLESCSITLDIPKSKAESIKELFNEIHKVSAKIEEDID